MLKNFSQIDPKRDVPYVLDTIKILTEEKLNVPLIDLLVRHSL